MDGRTAAAIDTKGFGLAMHIYVMYVYIHTS